MTKFSTYYFARPVFAGALADDVYSDVEDYGAHNVPELFVDESERDQNLGAFGDGTLTFIKCSVHDADAAGFTPACYAVGAGIGSANCEETCKLLSPAWAEALENFGRVNAIIGRQQAELELRDGRPAVRSAETAELYDYVEEIVVPLLASELGSAHRSLRSR